MPRAAARVFVCRRLPTGSAGATPPAPRVERISTATDGHQADGASSAESITANGHYDGFVRRMR